MRSLVNPLLPGFYPDPSICRVGDDFYMVTSSFSYFPGVPIFHSRDLCAWEQIGHCLTRPSQLPLDWQAISGSIYAPTLRFHQGLFYMVTTNVSHGGNFFVTAEDPAGPWSEPVYLQNAPGIDPTLFWDEDGRAYMLGTMDWRNTQPGVWIGPVDLQTGVVGERRLAWQGAVWNAWSPEAPHLYRKDGWYYLMIAEGGTEHYHAVTMARSRDILGPYEGYEGNPILTHRHLGENYPICNVGHADLVQLRDGSWYMVLLGSRLIGGYHKNLGRETFIAPVDWSGEWPVVSPGTGRVEWTYPAPPLPAFSAAVLADSFLDPCWNTLGTPRPGPGEATEGRLVLRAAQDWLIPENVPQLPAPNGCPGFYGRRQQHSECAISVRMLPSEKGVAGLMLLQNGFNQLRVEVLRGPEGWLARAVRNEKYGKPDYLHPKEYPRQVTILGQMPVDAGVAALQISLKGQQCVLGVNGRSLAETDAGFLGSESCGGFVGTYAGCFVSGAGAEAAFEDFHYVGVEDRGRALT